MSVCWTLKGLIDSRLFPKHVVLFSRFTRSKVSSLYWTPAPVTTPVTLTPREASCRLLSYPAVQMAVSLAPSRRHALIPLSHCLLNPLHVRQAVLSYLMQLNATPSTSVPVLTWLERQSAVLLIKCSTPTQWCVKPVLMELRVAVTTHVLQNWFQMITPQNVVNFENDRETHGGSMITDIHKD